MFGMRFVIDLAIDSPGIDLGEPPETRFDDAPRPLDLERSIRGFQKEVRLLVERPSCLGDGERSLRAVIAGNESTLPGSHDTRFTTSRIISATSHVFASR